MTRVLKDHEQRVVTEKAELDEKLAKLGEALNSGVLKSKVSDFEFSLLCEQERVMREYSDILARRIAAFESAR